MGRVIDRSGKLGNGVRGTSAGLRRGLYIPCGLPSFKAFKQWPHEAMQDGRAIVRIDGKRYPLQAVRMQDPGLFDSIVSKLEKKYPAPEDGAVAEAVGAGHAAGPRRDLT